MSDAEGFFFSLFFFYICIFYFFSQSFKLNVDSHCALKEAVVEEGRQLLELIVSHKSGKSFWNIASLYVSRLLKNEEALL